MVVLMLGAGLCLLLLLLSLAVRLRLGIPLVYVLLMLTVFHGWYQANTALADGILLLLVGAAALSWVVTLVRKAAEVLGDALAEHAAAKRLVQRVRQARAAGRASRPARRSTWNRRLITSPMSRAERAGAVHH